MSISTTYPKVSRRRSWLVKLFFRLTRRFVVSKNDPIHRYRKGIEFFTGFLGRPRKITVQAFKIEDVEAEWIIPKECADTPLVLFYLHGGGYAMGSIKSHRGIVARIARKTKTKALAINYRLAPEHVFPAPIEDSTMCYQWLLNQGYEPKNIVFIGDSAGGGLAMATLLNLRDNNLPLPLCGIGLSPWLDLEGSGDSYTSREHLDPYIDPEFVKMWGKRYLADTPGTHPLASPIYSEPYGLPPLLLQVGTHEVLHDDAITFAHKAAGLGVDVKLEVFENMFHVWHAFAGFMPEANLAVKNIDQFVWAQYYKAHQQSQTQK